MDGILAALVAPAQAGHSVAYVDRDHERDGRRILAELPPNRIGKGFVAWVRGRVEWARAVQPATGAARPARAVR